MSKDQLYWGQFGCKFPEDMTPQERVADAQKAAERNELAIYRADYQWIAYCQTTEIALLREIIASGPYVPKEDGTQPNPEDVSEPFKTLHMKRHRWAQIVLEHRERGYYTIDPIIC